MIANAAADRLIEPDDETRLRECVARAPRGGDDARVVLTSGVAVIVEREPLVDGGELLKLKPVTDARAERPQARDGHPAFGWESLTDTERSVIELVAQGLTNRQAAEQLFLSHHTVGFHLRSIFCKLAVSSRVELTRAAIEHDAGHRSAMA
jgi:DNA-binding CsgD family transcriptional regulator